MFNQMLKDVLAAYGPSGREKTVGKVIEKYVKPWCDKTYYDALGNLIAYKKGTSGKKLMLSAHMDQIGLIVTDIDDKGFLRVANVGGVNSAISIAREVVFENGTHGVTYFDTREKNTKTAEIRDMFIDIGASNREEAQKKADIGDVAVYCTNFVDMGNKFASGALDDRLCCAIIMEALRTCSTEHDLYVVFTVQEEVGCRGAGPAAFAIQPDLNINLDVTLTGDTPHCARMSMEAGKGPAIKVMDSSVIVPVSVRKFMEQCAKEEKIPCQNEVLRAGGTDTSSIQRSREGVLAGCISIATRYVHSPVETADMRDVMNAVKLINAMLKKPAKELPKA